jgi:hypothetical protein
MHYVSALGSGDARFDLQINNISHGLEHTVYGNGLISEVQDRTYRAMFVCRLLGPTKVVELLLHTPQCQGSVLPTC